MKINVAKSILLKSITIAQNAISSKSALPILSNLLLETTKEGLNITGTDLELGIVLTIQVEVLMDGSITVPAKRFMDIIKELPEANVSVSAKKNNMVHIVCENAQFKIMGIPKDDFPKLPEFKNKETIILKQPVFKSMLNMTAFAMSKDEARYVLNGIYMAVKGDSLRMVATDGRRLAMVEREITQEKKIEKKIILPAKTAYELARNLGDSGDVRAVFGDNQAMFDLGGIVIISRLVEGEFPSYEQVIPKESKDKLMVDREKLFLAAKRIGLLTTQDSQAVRFDVGKEKVVISKNSPDIGEATEELAANYEGSPLSIGFNPNYIMDALKNINEETIGFELQDAEKPGVIRTKERYIYVVLPMQLA